MLVAATGIRVTSLVVDATSVYWSGEGGIRAVPKTGGASRVVVPRGGGNDLIESDGQFFWTNFSNPSGYVATAPVSGGTQRVLATNLASPNGVAVAAGEVYWTTYGVPGTMARAPIGGGMTEVLVTNAGESVGIASDGFSVFWASQRKMTVSRFDIQSGAISVIPAKSGTPWSVTTDGVNVYWTEIFGGQTRIARSSVLRLDNETLAAVPSVGTCPGSGGNCQGNIRTDGVSVYWTSDEKDGAVRKVPVGGGPTVEVARGQNQPFGLAVDEACVYWGTFEDGAILVAPK